MTRSKGVIDVPYHIYEDIAELQDLRAQHFWFDDTFALAPQSADAEANSTAAAK